MLRAIAVASDTSDVVGTVDLSCERDGLMMRFVNISPYAAGYVPTVSVKNQLSIIPFQKIRAVSDDGETLRIELDAPKIPYKHLVLAHVTRDLRVTQQWLYKLRAAAKTVSAGAISAVFAGLLSWVQAPVWAASAVAFVGVAGSLWAGRLVSREVMLGGAQSAAERRLLFQQLQAKLGDRAQDLAPLPTPPPNWVPITSGGRPGIASTGGSPDSSNWMPTLLGVGAATMAALALVALGPQLLTPRTAAIEPEPEDPVVSDKLRHAALTSASALSSQGAAVVTHEDTLPTCLCQMADSPLFSTRIPKVSVLPQVKRASANPNRPSIDMELAAVNNSNSSLREIKGNVTFLNAPRSGHGPLRVGDERGVYYEGPLASGAAIKWRVKGRGTSYKVQMNYDSSLGEGEYASGDAFAQLLNARTRTVRLHGAAMLARMRDERAKEAIEKLREGAKDEENAFLDAISRASAPLYVCDVEMEQEGASTKISACLMNTTEELSRPLDAKLIFSKNLPSPITKPANASDEEEPQQGAIQSKVLARQVVIPPKTGVRIEKKVDFEGSVNGLIREVIIEGLLM